MYPFLNLRLWIIAKNLSGFRNISKGLRHVARLQWLPVYFCLRAQLFLDERNQFAQFDSPRLAEVDHFVVALFIVDGGAHASNDVVDKRIVTAGCAISKNWNRFVLANQAREFVNGEIGTLTWPVDCEEAQTDTAYAVKMCVRMAKQFAGGLGCCVGRDRLANRIVFTKRHFGVAAVDR